MVYILTVWNSTAGGLRWLCASKCGTMRLGSATMVEEEEEEEEEAAGEVPGRTPEGRGTALIADAPPGVLGGVALATWVCMLPDPGLPAMLVDADAANDTVEGVLGLDAPVGAAADADRLGVLGREAEVEEPGRECAAPGVVGREENRVC